MLCPIKKGCLSYRKGKQRSIPIKKKAKEITLIRRQVAVIHCGDEWLLKRGVSGKVMADLYEFPYFDETQEIPSGAFPFSLHFKKKLKEQHHSFTRYRVQLFPALWIALEKKEVAGCQWVKEKTLSSLPFSSGHRRILQSLGQDEDITY